MNGYIEDEKSVERHSAVTILRLFSYLLKYKLKVIAIMLLIGVTTIVTLINPKLIQYAVDSCIAKEDIKSLWYVVIFAAVINLIMVLASKLRMLLMAKTSNHVIEDIRQQLYEHIQKLDLKFFDSRPSGKILARITGDVNSLKEVIENGITTLVPEFVTVVAVVVIMLLENAKLALAGLFTLPLLIAGMTIISTQSGKYWTIRRKKASNLNAFISESLSGMKIIQSFAAEQETMDTFKKLTTEDRNAFKKAIYWADGFSALVELCFGVGNFALYFIGVKVIGIENVSVGTYMAFGTYMGMFWQPIMHLSQFYNKLVMCVSGAERVFEILDTEPGIRDLPDAPQMPQIKGSVEFQNVSFGYNSESSVLKNVSFTIKPGETIALVGPTGAGKTTIVNLISRFYDPSDGIVLIDGTDIKTVSQNSLRSQMGIMTQDNYIFSGTVKENILYGKLDASNEDVEKAAKSVMAHEIISKLKDGYNTKLTARGGELSNGERQLLAFARTMLSNPRILILDEATSNIDTKTEKLVQQGIRELLKDRTSFVIAHRLSTIQNADRIFVINQGGIKESGTPDELMSKHGEYYKLVKAQYSL